MTGEGDIAIKNIVQHCRSAAASAIDAIASPAVVIAAATRSRESASPYCCCSWLFCPHVSQQNIPHMQHLTFILYIFSQQNN
jgi:hypothetical protein